MESMMTLRGRRIDPQQPTVIVLHPGVGVSVDGQHLEGGARGTRHTVPFHIANELVASNRAHFLTADESATVATESQSRDPQPESRDPEPRRRR